MRLGLAPRLRKGSDVTTLDDIEKLTADLLAYSQRFGIVAEVHNGAMTERQLADLAHAVLAMLPVVRAAVAHEAARKECQRTGRHHGMLVLASETLEDAIDALRAALEST